MAEVPMNPERGLTTYNNSFAAKSSLVQAQQEKKEMPKMETNMSIRGQAVIKRRTPGQRFRETFLNNGDLKTVGGTIMSDVIVPAIKDMIFNGFRDALSMLLWGDVRQSRSTLRTGGGIVRDYTSYNNISSGRYRNGPDPAPSRSAIGDRYYDVLYTSPAAAHSVLDSMRDYINRYHSVPIVALCDFIRDEIGLQLEMTHMDAVRGWTDLTGIDVRPRYGGWILTYTDPIELEGEEYKVQR